MPKGIGYKGSGRPKPKTKPAQKKVAAKSKPKSSGHKAKK